ncbi:MAG TPA: hypothetical protein VK694_02835 [Verrucomicrobiae bacterium]|nr:hypothetical protein [Verrucomicrobiae bacterium]
MPHFLQIFRTIFTPLHAVLLVAAIVAGVFLPTQFTSDLVLSSIAIVTTFSGVVAAKLSIKDGIQLNRASDWYKGWGTLFLTAIIAGLLLLAITIVMECTAANYVIDKNGHLHYVLDLTRMGVLWLGFYIGMTLEAIGWTPTVQQANAEARSQTATMATTPDIPA